MSSTPLARVMCYALTWRPRRTKSLAKYLPVSLHLVLRLRPIAPAKARWTCSSPYKEGKKKVEASNGRYLSCESPKQRSNNKRHDYKEGRP